MNHNSLKMATLMASSSYLYSQRAGGVLTSAEMLMKMALTCVHPGVDVL